MPIDCERRKNMLKKEQVDEFEKLAKPLIKWINENGSPHSQVIIDCDSAQVFSGECSIRTDEFVKE
jgi:hypothetical protein